MTLSKLFAIYGLIIFIGGGVQFFIMIRGAEGFSNLEGDLPSQINIAGMYSPPFRNLSAQEDRAVVAQINFAKPDILWVGLGCPKQECWIGEHQHQLDVPVMLGVGQAFDILAGAKAEVPLWMQSNGLDVKQR